MTIHPEPGRSPQPPAWRFLACLITAVLSVAVGGNASAEDWGAYAIAPAGAQTMALEATGPGTEEGTLISIGKPTGGANQKWIITPKGNNLYTIKPASITTALVMAVAKGDTKNGTAVVLEAENGQPWQLWALSKKDNGSYNLIPQHAPEKGLDLFGGNKAPGAKVDLWQNSPNDQHLQWTIKPLAGSNVTSAPVQTVAGYEPPPIKPEDIKPGTIKQFTFTQSAIFPGTTRDVTVFIPAQYDGSKPSCVYVKTDGYNAREKVLMETMIATKEMPVTVGVFVRPGELRAPMPGTLGRRNRCFEYDGVSDNNVRFLVDELLPHIAREFDLKLSTDGNDRCISGGSSGGIAAFTAAWHRPDAFSRVYCASGSFVAFRGGHEFPTMVRKFEARPIRSYMTTGTRDMENCAGDWFLIDQEMDKALKFSGYDYFFRIINGGHVAGYMDHYQEAMAYLWKGWPERVQAGPSAPRARDVLLPGESWQPVAQGFKSIHGAACNAAGEVFFADTATNKVHRIDADGSVKVFLPEAGRANGLTVGADGRLYTVSSHTGRIMSFDAEGKGSAVLDGLRAHSILALPAGGFYVTAMGEKEEDGGAVWFVKDGNKTLVDKGLKKATGLAYRPDQWLLSVADGSSKWAYSYQFNPDGSLINKERFFHLHVADWDDDAGAEAICYAQEGQLFVATRSGVQICADDGPTQVILPVPDGSALTAVCLGGRDLDTLYAFSANQVWKRKVKTHAVGAFTPWMKVSGTKL